jgi:S-DNA-T family DNA segregation ATPase FtsK/SpoIIIE
VFILLDEVHELFLWGGKELAEKAERAVKRGRALAIHITLATQIPDKDSVPPNITRCVTIRWCMAVTGQVENDMILGTGAYKRGLSATVYRPKFDAGWGVMTGLERAGSVRSFFPDADTTKAIVARATALRGGRVVGASEDLAPGRDLLDDVLRVFAMFGHPNIHWKTLAELLAKHMPEAYDGITQDAISQLVRDKGVPSEGVKVDGVNLQGCKRRAVEAAVSQQAIGA